MELRLKPHNRNSYPLRGILIKSPSPRQWIEEIQALEWEVAYIQIFPIPGNVAKSLWGCLLLSAESIAELETGKHERCQMVAHNVYIPENSLLYPHTSSAELQQLFSENKHIIHPEFGWVDLEETIDLADLLDLPEAQDYTAIVPADSERIPSTVLSFEVRPPDPEDLIKQLEESIGSADNQMKDEPLDIFEKGKLKFYELFFNEKDEKEESEPASEKTEFLKNIESLYSQVGSQANWSASMQKEYEELVRRNQKQLDKLMEMLKNNPEEALKYAIPLDERHVGRGSSLPSDWGWGIRWSNFSLFGNSLSGGSGSIDLGEDFHKLKDQYWRTAQELIEKGDYRKAAFIYMKLLKDYPVAASTLEKGKCYAEAASIYLKHCNNKKKAAECYEAGNMIQEAIDLYIELQAHEKVGDLYKQINQFEKARPWYQQAIDYHVSIGNYFQAAEMTQSKLEEPEKAQDLLLDGWRHGRNAAKCLRKYFANIAEPQALKAAIFSVYQHEVDRLNRERFLHVLKSEYDKNYAFKAELREIAYEIISAAAEEEPDMVLHLREYNQGDKLILKDTLRYKTKNMSPPEFF